MMRPQDIGCLLLHGFTSSPAEMQELAASLRAQGYRLHLPVLPGHAATPDALLEVSYRDWLNTAEAAFRHLQNETRKQIVIGLSLGGALALHLAANLVFSGVVALAPALRVPKWQEYGAYLMGAMLRTRRKGRGPDVNDRHGRALVESYNEYPYSALYEVFNLQRFVRKELEQIKMPVLLIHSRRDHVVPLTNLQFIAARVKSTHLEKMVVAESYHVLTVDRDREQIFQRIHAFIQKVI
jgi:carboxylesterase